MSQIGTICCAPAAMRNIFHTRSSQEIILREMKVVPTVPESQSIHQTSKQPSLSPVGMLFLGIPWWWEWGCRGWKGDLESEFINRKLCFLGSIPIGCNVPLALMLTFLITNSAACSQESSNINTRGKLLKQCYVNSLLTGWLLLEGMLRELLNMWHHPSVLILLCDSQLMWLLQIYLWMDYLSHSIFKDFMFWKSL